MTCEQARGMLDAQRDGELDAAHEVELQRHLEACPACREEQAAVSALSEQVRAGAPYYPASEALRQRILAAMEPETATRRRRGFPWAWSAVAALAAALILVVALPRGANGLAQQVEAAHVRSLQADHLMDVVSTDQHTVKPWFHGRLDYAPPVNDFAPQGFALVGGRLDFLNGRNVAALVYRHKLHPINVFVWPSAGSEGRSEIHRDGYTLIQIIHHNMTYWLISDADAATLRQLADLLAAR